VSDQRVLRAFLTDDGRLHTIYAALRRYLVENDFLTREGAVYWRSGGTVEV